MFEKWLICSVFKGMFSDELAVKYGDSGYFVPRKDVRKTGGDAGMVRVRAFSQGPHTFAVLPTEDQAIIDVQEKDLVGA